MPAGGVVIDAFKSMSNVLWNIPPRIHAFVQNYSDLIRHGKQHHDKPGPPQDPQTQHQQQRRAQTDQTDQQRQAQRSAAAKEPLPSPGFRREAELIVQEEKEAKTKMPTYKGLENYKLLDKMGECVSSQKVSSISLNRPSIVVHFQMFTKH